MKLTSAFLFASLLCCSLCFAQQETLYVKPSEKTDCPPGFPCEALWYYAAGFAFTSNRLFIFLNGLHFLNGYLISFDAVNLTLRGESSGVRIACYPNSYIQIDDFSQLIIENLIISGDCESPFIFLNDGTNAHLSHLEIFTPPRTSKFLNATNIGGSFSITDSHFSLLRGTPLFVNYSECSGDNKFTLSNTTLLADSQEITSKLFDLRLHCDVDVVITGSNFGSNNNQVNVEVCGWSRSLLIRETVFTKSSIRFAFCSDRSTTCVQDCLTFTNLHMIDSQLAFTLLSPFSTTSNNSILIKNSIFSDHSSITENVMSVANPEASLKVSLIDVVFSNNTALSQIHLLNASVSYTYCAFDSNIGTVIQAINSDVYLNGNCKFEDNIGTAIEAQSSEITFQGVSTFRNNSGTIGGAIQLRSSYMHLKENASVLFVDNHADYLGGAIYIDHKEEDGCFFQSDSSSPGTFEVIFVNNTASYSGFAMYGNGISLCCKDSSCSSFLDHFNFSGNPSAIGSNPSKVCFCDEEKSQPDCTRANHSIDVFPGQEFSIHLAVLGTVLDSEVPGSIRAFNYERNVLQKSQTFQNSDESQCAYFQYTVNSTEESEKFSLTIDQSFIAAIAGDNPSSFLDVTAYLKDCPPGFALSNKSRGCECHPEIENYVQCNINNQSFLLPPNSWMGFNESCTKENCVFFSLQCPVGYCSLKSVSTSSSNPDKPCNSHRAGALCGKCEGNYSLALGSSVCMACSNFSLLLVIPMALAGLFLIVILFALNLTVAEGTINGLLFYANVIGLHYRELFVLETSYLYPFLAWINLDFGISTCFYDGMDYYQKTWLQFIFPVYLWTIILVILLLHKKFPAFAAKCGGENTVSVLATLLLMSFTKLINTVATILSFTQLGTENVWFYDASQRYFKDEHIPLGIAGILVVVLLILPYILIVTFFQQLQACCNFRWVSGLRPLFDAYAGPYKDKCRFWTGLLLMVRIGLVILFNSTRSLYVNLFVTVIVSFALAAACSIGIYKKWPCSFLELVFFCLLGIFAAGISYFKYIEKNITPFSDIFFGLSIIVFLGIVAYHGYCRLKGCHHHHRKDYESIVPPNDLNLVESKI